jgi:hypothetical protein
LRSTSAGTSSNAAATAFVDAALYRYRTGIRDLPICPRVSAAGRSYTTPLADGRRAGLQTNFHANGLSTPRRRHAERQAADRSPVGRRFSPAQLKAGLISCYGNCGDKCRRSMDGVGATRLPFSSCTCTHWAACPTGRPFFSEARSFFGRRCRAPKKRQQSLRRGRSLARKPPRGEACVFAPETGARHSRRQRV